VWDQDDRRAVRIEMTEAATKAVEALYGPLVKEGGQLLQTYTTQELAAVLRYLEDGQRLQRAHAQRIRNLGDTATAGTRGRRVTRPAKAPR
jgi:DNA-binding MarR family transcriptional regulator